jgi:FKBP-type peptidyl-prolyl cis-trans isomerase
MKYTSKAVVAALFASEATAIKQTTSAGPDIYGPNGDNYTNNDASYDLSRIGINITETGKGAACNAPNWATFHWKSILGDGREIENTKERFGEGQITRPDVITVGSRQSFHCFDLAFPQLHAGDKATLKCPSYFAYGGAHTISPLSDFTIPLNSDITFEVEMLECGVAPTPQPLSDFDQPHTTTMQPDKCIVFRSYEEQGSGNTDFVLTTVPDDDGTRILAIEHYQVDDKDQQWYYSEKTGSIYNSAYPE